MLVREAQDFRQTSDVYFRTAGELRRELTEGFAHWAIILRTLQTENPDADWGEGESICSEVKDEIIFLLAMSCGLEVRHEWRAPGWMAEWPMELPTDRAQMPASSLGLLDETKSKFVLAAITHFFVGANLAEAASEQPSDTHNFRHDSDFAWVEWKGHRHSLGLTARKAMRILHDAYERGEPEVSRTALMNEIGTRASRIRDVFKRSGLWKSLVVSTRSGIYRLDLPDPSLPKT